jgi:hypothetical protein
MSVLTQLVPESKVPTYAKIGVDVLLDILNCKCPEMKHLYFSPQVADFSLLPPGGSCSLKQYKLVCIRDIEALSNRRWQF